MSEEAPLAEGRRKMLEIGDRVLGPDAPEAQRILTGVLVVAEMLLPSAQISIVAGLPDADGVVHVGRRPTADLIAQLQVTLLKAPPERKVAGKK